MPQRARRRSGNSGRILDEHGQPGHDPSHRAELVTICCRRPCRSCPQNSVVQNNMKTTGGATGAGFKPGQSGNPGGRPRGLARMTRDKLGDDGDVLVEFWLGVMNDPSAKLPDRLTASKLLAERGWGRPTAVVAAASLDHRVNSEALDREIQELLDGLGLGAPGTRA